MSTSKPRVKSGKTDKSSRTHKTNKSKNREKSVEDIINNIKGAPPKEKTNLVSEQYVQSRRDAFLERMKSKLENASQNNNYKKYSQTVSSNLLKKQINCIKSQGLDEIKVRTPSDPEK